KTGFVWEKFKLVVERPIALKIALGQFVHGGGRGKPVVDCFLFTSDANLDPSKMDVAKLQTLATAPESTVKCGSLVTPPSGYVVSEGYPTITTFFSSVKDPRKQFAMSMVNNSSMYYDYARLVQLGFNEDHNSASEKYGVTSTQRASVFHKMPKKLIKPDAFFVNSKGTVSKRVSSLSNPALSANLREKMEKLIGSKISNKAIRYWTIAGESGGFMDYSPYSVKAFRVWLKKKHSNIATLNKHWRTAYKSFEEIKPPASAEENLAGWLEFRRFSGEVFSLAIAKQIPVIHKMDPLKRPCIAQSSNLNLLAPYFLKLRPMDYEQFNRLALKGEEYLAWDGYSTDDFIGCEFDLLQSLAPKKKLLVAEWNSHTPDARILARTAWGVIAKGLHGLTSFQFQEGTNHNSYPKWAFLNTDMTPKAKLGAIADIAHETKRIEPLLLEAKRAVPVKPVAMYYSQMDLALSTPESSLWGAGHDNPYRIYAILRGLGYSVSWISPKMIEEGKLADVGALIMPDCQHVPAKAAENIKSWVKSGGAVIADRWPGARNEYGAPQTVMSEIFGVKSSPKTKSKTNIGIEEAVTGYGPETGNAFNPEKVKQTIIEFYQQWDTKTGHPLGRAIGNFMLSGYGYERVKCTSGTVIAMGYDRGNPGIV
ncbi:MAG: beta-galactosidase, partial [Victivallales bacterium]|nr:beta-galactosidase [Victivallales bacterium]